MKRTNAKSCPFKGGRSCTDDCALHQEGACAIAVIAIHAKQIGGEMYALVDMMQETEGEPAQEAVP